jgi:hypothetical protein
MERLEHCLFFCTSQVWPRNSISIRKMDDAGVKTIFENETYKMVQGDNGVAEGSSVWKYI